MSMQRHRARGHRRHWTVVAGAACLMAAGEFVFMSASILNPDLARALGVGLSEVMGYNSLQSLAGVLATALIAPFVLRRFGVRKVVVVGGLWTAASLAAVALASNVPVLYALGFASGLAFGICTFMAGTVLVVAWFEHKRGTVMGGAFAASALGGVAAGLLLPRVVESSGFAGGFLSLAAVVVAFVVLPAVLLIRSTPADVGLLPYRVSEAPADVPVATSGARGVTERPIVLGVPARTAFRSPQFLALALGTVLFGMVQAVQQHYAPLAVQRGVTLEVAGALISLLSIALIVGNIALGTLDDRRGSTVAVSVALGCQLAAMVGLLLSSSLLPLAASTVVFAFSVPLGGVLLPILVMLLFGPHDYPAILGPASAMMPLGLAVGAPLWGISLDLTGSYDAALVAAMIATAAAVAVLVWAIRSAPNLRRRVERELAQR